jgi:hypothetical protein
VADGASEVTKEIGEKRIPRAVGIVIRPAAVGEHGNNGDDDKCETRGDSELERGAPKKGGLRIHTERKLQFLDDLLLTPIGVDEIVVAFLRL